MKTIIVLIVAIIIRPIIYSFFHLHQFMGRICENMYKELLTTSYNIQ